MYSIKILFNWILKRSLYKRKFHVFSLLLLGIIYHGGLWSQPPIDSLVSYFDFGSSTNDNLNNHNPVFASVSFVPDKFGNLNSAAQFNGLDDYLDLGNVLDMGSSDFAISLWFNADEIIDNNGLGTKLINKGLTTSGNPSNTGYGIRILKDGQQNKLRFLVAPDSTISSSIEDSSISPNIWYHVIVQRQSNTFELILNGNIVDSESINPSPILNTNVSFAIGALVRPPMGTGLISEFFKGKMDQIRVYKGKSLSNLEIQQLYDEFLGITGIDKESVTGMNTVPNPCDETVQFKFSTHAERSIQIFDKLGKRIIKVGGSGIQIDVNTSKLMNGIYEIICIEGTKNERKRLIVIH